MTTEVILWLLGTAVSVTGLVVAAFWNLNQRMAANHLALSERITKLETTFIMMGVKAAKILHADDDFHGLDKVLEQVVRDYEEKDYHLPLAKWQWLKDECARLQERENVDPTTKLLAAMVEALATHKLVAFSKLLKGQEPETDV